MDRHDERDATQATKQLEDVAEDHRSAPRQFL